MGLKDLAALAVEADEAQKRAARAENQRNHAKAAEQAVQQHLGLTGRCIAAPTATPDANMANRRERCGGCNVAPVDWGHDSIVVVKDEDMSLTIAVSNIGESTTDRYSTTYSQPVWTFKVTHIDGIDLTDGMFGEAGYKSRPDLRWNDVRFIRTKPAYDRSPDLNEVQSLADVGRMIAAWERFQAQRAAHLAGQEDN